MGRNKPAKNRDRKTKINLVFDETKRKEFLGGFHKRKVERRKKAQEELKQLLKEEKKRIKQENKESYKKLVVSSRPIPELERLLQEEYSDQEEDVSVKIVELSAGALGDTQRWIGENKPPPSQPPVKKKPRKAVTEDSELPGMALEAHSEPEDQSESEEEAPGGEAQSKKDIKKMLKRQATKKIQKSKAFQIKNKMERLKNKKKSRKTKNNNEKVKAASKNPRKNKTKKVIGRRKN